MNAIEIADLKLWYGTFQALSGVSLAVKQGGITSLIGPSGCGKTTLLRCLNRINERIAGVRTEGQIRLLGKNIYDADVSLFALRKAVGMVFQRPNPLPLSIFENVVFGMKLHAAEKAAARADLEVASEKALRAVQLWDRVKDKLNSAATELQLEEQQKLCIARLLPLEPEIILMDEPCSALDVAGTAAIEELLQGQLGPLTTLIVTHNMAQARRVSDHCAFLLNGKLVEHGPTEQVFESPREEQTASYLSGRFG
jgi:phosphate transport system ATP-binding protein